jgi:thiol-disulfide isomerase/thioredoxin
MMEDPQNTSAVGARELLPLDLIPDVAKLDASHFRDQQPWRLKGDLHPNHTIVLFHANWCGYCTRMKPDYNKFAKECTEEDCDIAAVDIDDCKSLTSKINEDSDSPLELKSWPTIILYLPGGRVFGKYEGERNVDAFKAMAKSFKTISGAPK